MEHGLLIAVEGIDKSGKETQVEELAKRFILDGKDVVTIDFPCYDTPSGQVIRAILDGIHPLCARNNPLEFQALMTVNRYEQQRRIEHALMSGKVVICDRYIYSSVAYGVHDGLDEGWLETIQHSMVKPDIEILLDISMEEYKRRIGNYEYLDVNEANFQVIQSVRELYLTFARNNGWTIINGERPVEEIANEMYQRVQEKITEMEE